MFSSLFLFCTTQRLSLCLLEFGPSAVLIAFPLKCNQYSGGNGNHLFSGYELINCQPYGWDFISVKTEQHKQKPSYSLATVESRLLLPSLENWLNKQWFQVGIVLILLNPLSIIFSAVFKSLFSRHLNANLL